MFSLIPLLLLSFLLLLRRLLLLYWNCELDVLCRRCGEDLEGSIVSDWEQTYIGYFFRRWAELKRGSWGCKASLTDSTTIRIVGIPAPLVRIGLLLGVSAEERTGSWSAAYASPDANMSDMGHWISDRIASSPLLYSTEIARNIILWYKVF